MFFAGIQAALVRWPVYQEFLRLGGLSLTLSLIEASSPWNSLQVLSSGLQVLDILTLSPSLHETLLSHHMESGRTGMLAPPSGEIVCLLKICR